MKHRRVETIDLLRLLAALAVVTYHYTFRGAAADGMTWLSLPALVPVTKYGYLGVQLFFVISGFVIAYSAEGRGAREFIVARASRIYPGFLISMTLTFLATVTFGAPRFEASLTTWLANFFIVAPALKRPFMDGAYWSIVYELVFYSWTLVFIATGLFARRLSLIVALWLALSLVNELFVGSMALRRLFVTDDSGFFAAGLMLYALFSGRRSILNWILLAAATAVGVKQALIGVNWDRAHFGVEYSDTVIAVVCIGIVVLVGVCLLPKRVPLPGGLVIALGGLTYPLYLLHQHLGFIIFNRFQGVPAPVLALMTASAMLGLAFLVWRFVERPGQRLMKAHLPQMLVWPKWLPAWPSVPPQTVSQPAAARRTFAATFGPVSLPRASR
jgi:peptidoglycan/LPS O-acetylase OafA/YrhL